MRPTAVIADDEPALRRHLERLLGTLWPELEIVASVGDGSAAREAIDANEPDVAFLDIRMPAPDGLTLAAELAGRAAIALSRPTTSMQWKLSRMPPRTIW